ncbi:hypothetical protein [Streptomyces sp. 184]|uniref:hypothetical protein n=1 Tax=Streptomyces sp. 184 TaxID=1827526 RepID=UPI0038923CAE
MPRQGLSTRSVRVATTVALACGLALATAGQASADRPSGGTTYDPSGGSSPGAGFSFRYSSPGSGGTPMQSSNANWSPPPCWYAPTYTNDSLDKHNEELHEDPTSGVRGDVLERRKEETEEKRKSGEEGMWWERKPDDAALLPRECNLGEWIVWVEEGDPDPPEGAVDPEILAGFAYERMKLPAPPIDLKPDPDRNVVNLPTKIEFSEALQREWVTANYDNAEANVHIAATTVAQPVSLRIEAGTEYAEPNACEYRLTGGGDGGYQVNSDDAGCNITYRKSSGEGTYPLRAEIVWEVSWNATDNPDGPPEGDPELPNGLSVFEQDVTVKEIQTVVR